MGKADIPENHQPPSAGDRDTLASLLAGHRIEEMSTWRKQWRCTCGEKIGKSEEPAFLLRTAHRAHVADVLLASDWLREQRTEAWKAGHGWCDDGDLGCDHEPFTPNPYLED